MNNLYQYVRKFDDENRTKLLLFATSNSQIPVTGFKDLQESDNIQHFTLRKVGTEQDLPKSHTWQIYIYIYIFLKKNYGLE